MREHDIVNRVKDIRSDQWQADEIVEGKSKDRSEKAGTLGVEQSWSMQRKWVSMEPCSNLTDGMGEEIFRGG
jgi:hypothetical protein